MKSFLHLGQTSSIAFGIATALLFSCGKPAAPQASESKIYGGQAVPKNQRLNVIAITDSDGIFCSGTALSPTLIVTAAHCVLDETPENIKVYVGEGLEGGEIQGQYAVKKMEYNPAYDESSEDSAFDVGYLVLEKALDLPADAYTPVLTDAKEIKELLIQRADSYLVGFGMRKKDGYGVKYEAKTPVKKVYKNEILIGANGRDACQGDSGGPAFGLLKSGEWRVYGVVSRGGDCGNGGYWGLLHQNICWVKQASGEALDLPLDLCKKSQVR